MKEAKKFGILPIDMVVCNFYPFEKVISKKNFSLKEAVESIDIGGPVMVRAGAKNYKYVTVLTEARDYQKVIDILKQKKEIPLNFKLKLAQKTFEKTAEYDKKISRFLEYGRIF